MDNVTVKDFYATHKDEILKLVASEHLNNPTLSGLKYEFTAQSGKKWYSFPERMALPTKRYAKMLEHIDWLKNGMAPDEFDKIGAKLQECFAHIKARTDKADEKTKDAGILLAEMERRRAQAYPYGVLITLICDVMVREDEDPAKLSSVIHIQKCDELEFEINSGRADFFLTLPQLKPLNIASSTSPEGLIQFLQGLRIEAEKETENLRLFLSWIDAGKGTKTLSNP